MKLADAGKHNPDPDAPLRAGPRGDGPPIPRRRYKSSHSCRICSHWLEGDYAGASDIERITLMRQMEQGVCDKCVLNRDA